MSQQGGMINPFQAFLMNLDSPALLIFGFVLILVIVYSSNIPTEYRIFADSLLGRVVAIAVVYGIVEAFGWVYGLLAAMAYILILNGVSRSNTGTLEGFDGGGTVSEKKIIGRRWFVEKVLGEHPRKIATDRVYTSAVEDFTNSKK
jgi:hypothetical protein